MANRMILNETSYFGAGSISEIVTEAKKRAFKKALVVTDPDLIKFNVAKNVTDLLEKAGLAYDIFSQVKANPTVKVVKAGIEAFKAADADYLIAIGGGSSMDTAKAIVWINANELSLLLLVCDNIVDSYLCGRACCCRNCDYRNARILCVDSALKRSNVSILRVVYDDTDSLCSVH